MNNSHRVFPKSIMLAIVGAFVPMFIFYLIM